MSIRAAHPAPQRLPIIAGKFHCEIHPFSQAAKTSGTSITHLVIANLPGTQCLKELPIKKLRIPFAKVAIRARF